MSKTRIVIIQLKEIIYTAIFVGLGILLILLLIFMFLPDKDDSLAKDDSAKYKPGVYTTQVKLNNADLNLEVVVDSNHINSVRFVNLDQSVTTMYPLIKPSLESITTQLYNDVDVKDVTLSADSKYTESMILQSIEQTLEKATP